MPAATLEGTSQPPERASLAVQSETPLLIGVDGGATQVRAHAIEAVGGDLTTAFQRAAFTYEVLPGFEPAPLDQQIAECEGDRVRVGDLEREQGERWIDACAHAIESVAAGAGRARVVVGMCMPGLKTRAGRGIDAMRNGPRVPDFLDRLEGRIARAGIVLATPIARLESDGDACGHGEEASPDGSFRGVANAYYVGGGTGLAECFKLEGRVTSLDELDGAVTKAWAMKSSIRRSYEDHISVRGIDARWTELGGAGGVRPEEALPRGDLAAIQAFSECVVMLDELLRARIASLERLGSSPLERFVVGQRLGVLLASPGLSMLRASAERACPIDLCFSTLQAAPAIGAARLALEAWRRAAPTGGATHAV